MEATVRPYTGMLPDNMACVALRNLDDGRWQLAIDFDVGASRVREFEADAQDEQRIARMLQMEFGFSAANAKETARWLLEPFAFAAAWAW